MPSYLGLSACKAKAFSLVILVLLGGSTFIFEILAIVGTFKGFRASPFFTGLSKALSPSSYFFFGKMLWTSGRTLWFFDSIDGLCG